MDIIKKMLRTQKWTKGFFCLLLEIVQTPKMFCLERRQWNKHLFSVACVLYLQGSGTQKAYRRGYGVWWVSFADVMAVDVVRETPGLSLLWQAVTVQSAAMQPPFPECGQTPFANSHLLSGWQVPWELTQCRRMEGGEGKTQPAILNESLSSLPQF